MARDALELTGTPEELFHWVPGEMVVVLRLPRRPSDDLQDTLVEQVRNQLNIILAPYNFVLDPYGSQGRWQDQEEMPRIQRHLFLFGFHQQQPLAAIFFHATSTDSTIPDPVPMVVSYLQGHLEQLAQAGLFLISAMPNWLVTAAPALYANGGPALPPRPAPSVDLPSTGNAPLGWHVSFTDQNLAPDSDNAQDVLVAVLDTAHHSDSLHKAAMRPELRRNWLLQRLAANLRSQNGSFEIAYDRYPIANHICTGCNSNGYPFFYPMPDHGIFVAGLIRDIAPHARIRLIRILNDYGGGDLYNLFAALTDLEQELVSRTTRRLVINLSLTIMPDLRRLPYIWFADRDWPSRQLAGAMRALAHIEEGLRLLFDSLYTQGALIVAAAGNDSFLATKQGQRPRPPRAPARYESTLGVTSVNSRFEPSPFANAASIPPFEAGVATFGGDIRGATDAHGLPEAVRGIYLSPTFPGGKQNLSGWADWCGSSFSTAIISALAAHLMAQGRSAPETMHHIIANSEGTPDKLFGIQPEVPSLLANIIKVQQHFGM